MWLLWNIEADKRCIVVELYQFLSIYYWLVRIFNSSDDALLVRAKRQPSSIDFVRVGRLLWNIETDKRCIVVELYQFLYIYYWLVRIFNSSNDALLVRAKCRPSSIDFVRVGRLLWNIETDKRCIVVEFYQFLNIYY